MLELVNFIHIAYEKSVLNYIFTVHIKVARRNGKGRCCASKLILVVSVMQSDTDAAGVLQAVYQETSHLPKCPEHRKICHMLALRHLATDPVKAAFYLNEAMALTFRHQALLNLCQQIR